MEKCIKGAGAEAGSERRRGNKWDDVKEHSLFLYPLFFLRRIYGGISPPFEAAQLSGGVSHHLQQGPYKVPPAVAWREVYLINARTKADRRAGQAERQ